MKQGFYSFLILITGLACLISCSNGISFLDESDALTNKRNLKEFLLTMDNHSDAFKIWHYHHQKHNTYQIDSEEGLRRLEIFRDNYEKIKERNNQLSSYKLGLGPHADLTREEFVANIAHKNISNKKNNKKHFLESYLNSEDIWDTTKKIKAKPINTQYEDWEKYFEGVRDQGECGSCWTFAVTGSIEGRLSKINGKYQKLSTKYLLDCSTKDNGCDGGAYDTAFEFVLANGVIPENDYPYIPKQETCRATNKLFDKTVKLNRMLYCSNQDDNEANHCNANKCKEMLQYSPIATAIDAEGFDFQHYSTGIFKHQCARANHAVIITSITDEYVKIRNSWGDDWGEKGYMKIERNAKNADSCFTERDCFAAIYDE